MSLLREQDIPFECAGGKPHRSAHQALQGKGTGRARKPSRTICDRVDLDHVIHARRPVLDGLSHAFRVDAVAVACREVSRFYFREIPEIDFCVVTDRERTQRRSLSRSVGDHVHGGGDCAIGFIGLHRALEE